MTKTRRKRTKRKKTKKIGARVLRWAVVAFLLGSAIVASSAERKRSHPAPTAIIAGTVFRNTGLSLPGAEITVTPAPLAEGKAKLRPVKALSDARGEFVIRVPAGPARYRVAASARGYQTAEQTIEIQGEERVDLTFLLDPAPGQDKKADKK